MARGAGQHIRRVDMISADWFPYWSAGPLLPAELARLCDQQNAGRPAEADKFHVSDEDGNILS